MHLHKGAFVKDDNLLNLARHATHLLTHTILYLTTLLNHAMVLR